jgi:hypothetical protein
VVIPRLFPLALVPAICSCFGLRYGDDQIIPVECVFLQDQVSAAGCRGDFAVMVTAKHAQYLDEPVALTFFHGSPFPSLVD